MVSAKVNVTGAPNPFYCALLTVQASHRKGAVPEVPAVSQHFVPATRVALALAAAISTDCPAPYLKRYRNNPRDEDKPVYEVDHCAHHGLADHHGKVYIIPSICLTLLKNNAPGIARTTQRSMCKRYFNIKFLLRDHRLIKYMSGSLTEQMGQHSFSNIS